MTIDNFLSTHDPSCFVNFYQIFDKVPEGVNDNCHSNPEGAVPVESPVGVGSCRGKRVVGFRQESIWSTFLQYLRTMESTTGCYISFLDLLRCFRSIVNNNSLLIIDSGASVCITPHQSIFVTHKTSKMKIKDLSSSNTVAGEGLMRWKVKDLAGRVVNLELPGYHIPGAEVCLLVLSWKRARIT